MSTSSSVSELIRPPVLWRALVAALIIGGRLYAERFVPRGRSHRPRRSVDIHHGR
jgi:hypothetical protein